MFLLKKTKDIFSILNSGLFSFTSESYKKELDDSYSKRIELQKRTLLNKKHNKEFLLNFRHPLSPSIIVEQHLLQGHPKPNIKNLKQLAKYILINFMKIFHSFSYAEKDWLKWSFNRFKISVSAANRNKESLSLVGNPPFINTKNFKWNLRHLRYLIIRDRLYSYLSKEKLSKIKSVIDLGGCYGGYISLLAKDNPNRSYVLVDLAENIPLATYYLSSLHPNMNIKVINKIDDDYTHETNTFTLIPAHLFNVVKNYKFDLFCNFVSLAEMSRKHFDEYIDSSIYKEAKYIHLVNRFVSSPSFSRGTNPHTWMLSNQNIYDYGLDRRKNIMFDVFPLYHFFPISEDKFSNPREYKFTSFFSLFWKWKRSPITSQYFESISEIDN
tara:strand:+ start:30742 stop:31890 length:1149 start_codon:yes stop_codon:yes gene_type:complete